MASSPQLPLFARVCVREGFLEAATVFSAGSGCPKFAWTFSHCVCIRTGGEEEDEGEGKGGDRKEHSVSNVGQHANAYVCVCVLKPKVQGTKPSRLQVMPHTCAAVPDPLSFYSSWFVEEWPDVTWLSRKAARPHVSPPLQYHYLSLNPAGCSHWSLSPHLWDVKS